MLPARNVLLSQVNLITFAVMVMVVTVVYNGVFFLFFRRTEEFGYLWRLLQGKIANKDLRK